MKRAISWILVAAIMLGFVGMIAFSVFAEGYVERVWISTPDFQVGDAISTDFALQIDGGNLVEIKGWLDQSFAPASGVFEENKIYHLQIVLDAPEGYAYSERDTLLIINDWTNDYGTSVDAQDESRMLVTIKFDFNPTQITRVSLEGLPEDLEPGGAVAPETVWVLGDVATVSGICWMDADKQPVSVIEVGKEYLLEVTLAPAEGFEFRDWFDAYGSDGWIEDWEIISKTEAKVWVPYSTCPGVGDVVVTVSGIEEGAPVSGVTVTLPEDAKVSVDDVIISDEMNDHEEVTEGNFEHGHKYIVTILLGAVEGYDAEKYESLTVYGGDSWSGGYWNDALQVNCFLSTCDPVGLADMTSSGLEVGAPISGVALTLKEGTKVTLDSIEVMDWDSGKVLTEGVFEKGRDYLIRYHVKYPVDCDPEKGIELILNGKTVNSWSSGGNRIVFSERFTTCEVIPEVRLNISQFQVGDTAADVEITSDSEHYTLVWELLDDHSRLPAETFQQNHEYVLYIYATAKDDYRFREDAALVINDSVQEDCYWSINGDCVDATAVLYYSFRNEQADRAYVSGLPEEIVPGTREVPELTVQEGPVTITEVRWVDADKIPVVSLKDGNLYYLEVTLAPAEGYSFRDYLEVMGDWKWAESSELLSENTAKAWFRYSLQPGVGVVALTTSGMGVGKAFSDVKAQLPADAKVELVEIRVYDANTGEELVDGSFRDNSRYTIAYVIEAKDGYDVQKLDYITLNGEDAYEWDCWGDQLEVYERFSTCEPLGELRLTSSGMAEGRPVSEVQLEIPAGAGVELAEIQVYDYDTGEPVTEFKSSRTYEIRYILNIKEGYSPEDGLELYLNGKETSCGYDSVQLECSEIFSTCEPVETVKLTVPEPQVGASIANAVVTGNCQVEYQWMDETDWGHAEGTFQKGHVYALELQLHPLEGQIFTEDTKVQINGVNVEYLRVEMGGMYAYGHHYWSFLEQITKVELPAVPEKLKKGDKLSAISAPSGANYTVEATWYCISVEEAEEVSKVAGNGSYVLQLELKAEEGYEFAEDVAVTFGGKTHTSLENYGQEMYLTKVYNVGMTAIDRVDVPGSVPKVGATAVAPEFAGTGYSCVDSQWLQNGTDDYMQGVGCETFQPGQYTYLVMLLSADEGYAFAESIQYYVGGEAVTVAAQLDMGYLVKVVLSFGKLRELGSVGKGDLDGVAGIDEDDAIYLLRHILMPSLFPVDQDVDYNGDGKLNEDDAIHLLRHVLMPELFPLK